MSRAEQRRLTQAIAQAERFEMEEIGKPREVMSEQEEEDAKAEVDVWKYIFGFVDIAVVKCAIELGIADLIKDQEQPMTLTELSNALGCDSLQLYRIMRFLVNQKVFKEKCLNNGNKCYGLTPLSRLLMKHGEHSMASLVLLESSPVMLTAWHALSARVRENGKPSFEAVHGEDVWGYAAGHPAHSELINNAMACNARLVVPAILDGCAQVFDGVDTLVDVGGGDGTMLRGLVKAFPGMTGLNFDLPHVVAVAPECENVKHIAGDMFHVVPKADATFLKWVLHDWGDKECIEILKKCRESLPENKGKVIIVEAVIEEDEHKLKDVRLQLDMVMMAHTNYGKERTLEEWRYILSMAGFSMIDVHPIHAVQSVIVAYP